MRLRFTRRAAENLEAIADYLRNHDPSAATRVRAAIQASLRKLVTRYRYLVDYAIDGTERSIVILAVRHSAQARDFDDA